MSITLLERLEGLVLGTLALGVVWYGFSDYGWFIYIVLFLLPDISMAGYLHDPRAGAVVYNLGHSFVAPLLLAAVSFWLQAPTLYLIALLWIAHIGIDRALGFGFKLPSDFRNTHLGELGRR